MAKYYIILIFAVSVFTSCSSNYLKACFENLSAIYLAEKGEADKAITVFGKAVDNIDNNKYKKYVEYNISSLYREMGEHGAAELKLFSIDAGNDNDLKYRICCELGNIAFQKGDYEKAAGFFKNGILINNNDIKLIQNLEFALLLMNEDNKKKEENVNYIMPIDKESEGVEKLLNIMFSGESLFWIEDTPEKREQGKDW